MRQRSSNRKQRVIRLIQGTVVERVCEAGITGLLLGMLALTPLAFGGVPSWALLAAECLILLAGALWLVLVFTHHEYTLTTTPFLAPILILGGYIVFRYSMVNEESLARTHMMLALSGVLLFLLVLQHLSHRRRVTSAAAVLVGTGCLVAGWGIYQWLFNDHSIWGQVQPAMYHGRASGPFVRPDHFGGYLAMTFAITTAFFFFSRWTTPVKIGLSLAAVFMGLAIFASSSTPAVIGLLAAIGVVAAALARHQAYRFRWLAVGGCLMLVVVVGVLLMVRSGHLRGEDLPQMIIWKDAWTITRNDLLIGNGPGVLPWLYPTKRAVQGSVTTSGNEFVDLLGDYGLVGVGLAVWLIGAFLYTAGGIVHARLKRYSNRVRSNRYALVVGSLAAVVAATGQALFDCNLHAPANLFTLLTLAAMAVACGVHPETRARRMQPEAGTHRSTPVKGLAKTGLMLSVAAVMVLLATRLWVSVPSQFYLLQAERARANLDWAAAVEFYQKAWRHDPKSYDIAHSFGDYYLARATWNAAQREEWEQNALVWFERAHIHNPYAADVLVKKARLLDARGDQAQAHQRYRLALEFDPTNASYHAQLGLHYRRWNKIDEATASFIRAYELGGAGELPAQQLRQLGLL